MDRPPPDIAKLHEAWEEWERGDATPGHVMSQLKRYGMRDLLHQLAEAAAPSGSAP